jgi:tRNA(Ile2) C34 agmatinyltransferase TiaS
MPTSFSYDFDFKCQECVVSQRTAGYFDFKCQECVVSQGTVGYFEVQGAGKIQFYITL